MKKRGFLFGLTAMVLFSGCGRTKNMNMSDDAVGRYAESVIAESYKKAHPEEYREKEMKELLSEETAESVPAADSKEAEDNQEEVNITNTDVEVVASTATEAQENTLEDIENEKLPMSNDIQQGESVKRYTKCRANVRETPSSNGKIYCGLDKGLEVIVVADDGEWSSIQYEGGIYYVASRLLVE